MQIPPTYITILYIYIYIYIYMSLLGVNLTVISMVLHHFCKRKYFFDSYKLTARYVFNEFICSFFDYTEGSQVI